jgi:hypothetical protein
VLLQSYESQGSWSARPSIADPAVDRCKHALKNIVTTTIPCPCRGQEIEPGELGNLSLWFRNLLKMGVAKHPSKENNFANSEIILTFRFAENSLHMR